jgi:hypothetical protein
MGGWFSRGLFSRSNPNKEIDGNTAKLLNGLQSNNRNNTKIFEMIKNIYVQRHAVSCANTIEKVFGKNKSKLKLQQEKSKYSANSGISYVGVQQCLQVSDYFSKNPINSGNPAANGNNLGNKRSGNGNNLGNPAAKVNNSGNKRGGNGNNSGNPAAKVNNSGNPAANVNNSGNPAAKVNNLGNSAANGNNLGNSAANGNNLGNPVKKPLLIFCCSELIRTQQTLFLSWIRYLKDYKEKNGKIIVIPWLNEVSARKIGTYIFNKDNYPESSRQTEEDWIKFIENLIGNIPKIKDDTLNPNSTLFDDIEGIRDNQKWDELFYLSPVIYKTKEEVQNRLSNNGKKISIRRKGIVQQLGDLDQFIGLFSEILQTYITEQGINILEDYDGIELVIVAHHNSAEKFMEFVMPSTHAQFKKIQLVNCEVVKLPGQCLQNFVTGKPTQGEMVRIFPMKFNTDGSIFTKGLSIIIDGKEVYPLFILYISSLDLFLSVNNIVRTKLKGKGMNEPVQIKQPIYLFLKTSIFNYRIQLGKIKKYIETIQEEYTTKSGDTFYNYAEMIKRIGQKNSDINQYMIYRKTSNTRIPRNFFQKIPIKDFIENKINNNEKNKLVFANMKSRKISLESNEIYAKLRKYLFGMCELKLNQEIIDSIAVF